MGFPAGPCVVWGQCRPTTGKAGDSDRGHTVPSLTQRLSWGRVRGPAHTSFSLPDTHDPADGLLLVSGVCHVLFLAFFSYSLKWAITRGTGTTRDSVRHRSDHTLVVVHALYLRFWKSRASLTDVHPVDVQRGQPWGWVAREDYGVTFLHFERVNFFFGEFWNIWYKKEKSF